VIVGLLGQPPGTVVDVVLELDVVLVLVSVVIVVLVELELVELEELDVPDVVELVEPLVLVGSFRAARF
jgi:hypothetical protein